jgi:hypothetical protein
MVLVHPFQSLPRASAIRESTPSFLMTPNNPIELHQEHSQRQRFNIIAHRLIESSIAMAYARRVNGLARGNSPLKDKTKDFILYRNASLNGALIPQKPALVEVKCDWSWLRHRNVCLETRCNGSASGLSATHASIWLHYLPKSSVDDGQWHTGILLVFNPKWALRWCKETRQTFKLEMGDGNADGYVVFAPRFQAQPQVKHYVINL